MLPKLLVDGLAGLLKPIMLLVFLVGLAGFQLAQGAPEQKSQNLVEAAFSALSDEDKEAFISTLEAGVNVNATDEVGISLLMEVADVFPDLVPRLIELGADVNYRTTTSSQTPLLEAMTQRNVENVRALLDAGATLTADEQRYAQNILSSIPDVDIARMLGFPTTDEDGDPIDQHEFFGWARDTRVASRTCSTFIKDVKQQSPDVQANYGLLDSGQFDPAFERTDVLTSLDEFTSTTSSASFLESSENELWLSSVWTYSEEYLFTIVYRQTPVFCHIIVRSY